jgi:DNA-binding NtrC family response regulator
MERSILLVDGDVNFRRSLAIALRLDGVQVEEAGGPIEARRHLAAAPFDLAVVDLLLPPGDAVELIEWIRDRHPAIRPVACCARPEAFAVARMRLGGVTRLEKPFAPERLFPLLGERAAPVRLAR